MASEKVTIDFELGGDIANELDQVNRKLNRTIDKTNELGNASSNSGGSIAGKLNPALIAGAGAMGALTMAADLTARAISNISEFLADSIMLYEEQSDVNRLLKRSIDGTNLSAIEFNKVFNKQQDIISDLAQKTRFADEEISRAGSSLQNMTGISLSSAEGTRALSLALDVAAGSGEDLKGVTEDIAKAQKGEISAIEKYVKLTKEQKDELNQIKSAKDRARRALEMLSDTYGEAAVDLNKGFFGELKNLQDALDDTRQKIGEVIVESKALDPIIGATADSFVGLQEILEKNSRTIQLFLIVAMIEAVDVFINAIEVLDIFAPVVASTYHGLMSLGHAMDFIYDAITLAFGAGIQGAIEKIKIFVGFLKPLAEFSPTLKKIVSSIDETAGKGLAFAKKQNKELQEDLVKSAEASAESMRLALESGLLQSGTTERIKAMIADLREGAKELKRDLLTTDLSGNDDDGGGSGGGGGGGGTNDTPTTPEDDEDGEDIGALLEKAQIQARRNTLLEYELEISQAKSEIDKLLLSFEKDKFDILTSNLNPQEEALRLKILESETENALNEILAERNEITPDPVNENEILRERIELIQQQTAAINGTIGALSAFGDVGSNFGGILSSINQTVGKFKELEAAGKNGAAAIAGGLSATGQAAAGFAESMGASAALQAGILSAFETAAGFASLAIFDYFGAANHFISAGIYAGVAATSAGGGNVQKKSVNQSAAGGSAGRSAGGESPNFEDIADLQAQKIAEAMGAEGGGTSQIVINLGGANVFSDDPQTYRTLFDGIESEARNRGVILGNN